MDKTIKEYKVNHYKIVVLNLKILRKNFSSIMDLLNISYGNINWKPFERYFVSLLNKITIWNLFNVQIDEKPMEF